ncbi:helix-turn-helix transcriptional regulator [Wukongibacter baidiensis]|uniref:helix-turn-helix domain-containing protein n=1 Tax=Wukongibacter baidiensis TaxID=1723361 RepID=UPI003D7F6822
MVGKRIKELRKQKKLSLKDLSERIDMSISFLSDIENGKSNPSLIRLREIAKGLDTTVSNLLGEYDNLIVNPNIEILLKNPAFLEILEEFKDFDSWSDDDKNEILAYLRAKKVVRSSM